MKCPNCGNKLDELEMKCLSCGTDFSKDDTTSKYKNYGDKTLGLGIINVIQLTCCIIIGLVSFCEKNTSQGFIYVLIGLITYFFIKGFMDIIDLLDSINDKIDIKK